MHIYSVGYSVVCVPYTWILLNLIFMLVLNFSPILKSLALDPMLRDFTVITRWRPVFPKMLIQYYAVTYVWVLQVILSLKLCCKNHILNTVQATPPIYLINVSTCKKWSEKYELWTYQSRNFNASFSVTRIPYFKR